MSETFKLSEWDANQFRIDARNKVNEIRNILERNETETKSMVERVFAQEKAQAHVLETAQSGQGGVRGLVHALTDRPNVFGRLRTGHEPEIALLLEALSRRDGLLSSQREFEKLSERAEEIERLLQAERKAEMPKLKEGREYCNSNFDARETHYAGLEADRRRTADVKAPDRRQTLADERSRLLEANRHTERQRTLERSREKPELEIPDPDLGGR